MVSLLTKVSKNIVQETCMFLARQIAVQVENYQEDLAERAVKYKHARWRYGKNINKVVI